MPIAKMILVLFVATFTTWAVDAAAKDEIYRWVDENGVVHFGDQEPANTDAERVTIQTSKVSDMPAASDTGAADTSALLEPQKSAAQQAREARAEKRAEIAERKRIIAEACAQRRTIVSQLEPSTRVMVRTEDGSVTRMDDDVRLETLDEARSYIAENCEK